MLLDDNEGTVVIRVGEVTITITSPTAPAGEILNEVLAERALLDKVRFFEGV